MDPFPHFSRFFYILFSWIMSYAAMFYKFYAEINFLSILTPPIKISMVVCFFYCLYSNIKSNTYTVTDTCNLNFVIQNEGNLVGTGDFIYSPAEKNVHTCTNGH